VDGLLEGHQTIQKVIGISHNKVRALVVIDVGEGLLEVSKADCLYYRDA
jgi:hypothetical protein